MMIEARKSSDRSPLVAKLLIGEVNVEIVRFFKYLSTRVGGFCRGL